MIICACDGVVVNVFCSASEHKSNLRWHQEGHPAENLLESNSFNDVNLLLVTDLFIDFILVFC